MKKAIIVLSVLLVLTGIVIAAEKISESTIIEKVTLGGGIVEYSIYDLRQVITSEKIKVDKIDAESELEYLEDLINNFEVYTMEKCLEDIMGTSIEDKESFCIDEEINSISYQESLDIEKESKTKEINELIDIEK